MRVVEGTEASLAAKFEVIFPHLDERQRRLLMGAEARVIGHGGIRLVAGAADVREATVSLGVSELDSGAAPLGRVRRSGGGRKRVVDLNPGLRSALLALVEPDHDEPARAAPDQPRSHRPRASRPPPPAPGSACTPNRTPATIPPDWPSVTRPWPPCPSHDTPSMATGTTRRTPTRRRPRHPPAPTRPSTPPTLPHPGWTTPPCPTPS